MRETVAAADLIPGDVVLPMGDLVVGYPHGVGALPGTLVPMDEDGLLIGRYYGDTETPVSVLR